MLPKKIRITNIREYLFANNFLCVGYKASVEPFHNQIFLFSILFITTVFCICYCYSIIACIAIIRYKSGTLQPPQLILAQSAKRFKVTAYGMFWFWSQPDVHAPKVLICIHYQKNNPYKIINTIYKKVLMTKKYLRETGIFHLSALWTWASAQSQLSSYIWRFKDLKWNLRKLWMNHNMIFASHCLFVQVSSSYFKVIRLERMRHIL